MHFPRVSLLKWFFPLPMTGSGLVLFGAERLYRDSARIAYTFDVSTSC